MAAIRLELVDKVYPNGQIAARGLDLEVADGELLVLVGPSGCGKTTALRLVAGLEMPTAGRILIDNRDVTNLPPRQRDIAMVFQNYALYPHMTVQRNLEFGLRMRRTPRHVIAERVRSIAAVLGLEQLLKRKPAELSGGERQRVALGRAIVREPRGFLLDEPLSNLDEQLRVEMRTELGRLHRRLKTTMLYVTHDQEEAMTLGDRVAVMRAGVLQQIGTPLEVYRRPVNQFVAGFIGAPAMNFFKCEVENDGNGIRLRSPWFALALDSGRKKPISKQEVTLGVRPQDVHVVARPEADAVARVDLIQPLGSQTLVHVVLEAHGAEQRLTLIMSAESPVRADEHVPLRFARERLHYFRVGDGAALQETTESHASAIIQFKHENTK